jgi:CsoR family transcriptional regulator, copper-sensing transcriptional repressor
MICVHEPGPQEIAAMTTEKTAHAAPPVVVAPGAASVAAAHATSVAAHAAPPPASLPGTFRHSYSRDRSQLLRRLSRIEGQVRGIARMIEREEYCVDILQQTSALRAAVDAVSLLVLEDHVQGCIRTAAERGEAEQYVDEVLDVVRRTLGRPVRSASRG